MRCCCPRQSGSSRRGRRRSVERPSEIIVHMHDGVHGLCHSWRLTIPNDRRIATTMPPISQTTQRSVAMVGGGACGCSNDALVRNDAFVRSASDSGPDRADNRRGISALRGHGSGHHPDRSRRCSRSHRSRERCPGHAGYRYRGSEGIAPVRARRATARARAAPGARDAI